MHNCFEGEVMFATVDRLNRCPSKMLKEITNKKLGMGITKCESL